MRTTQFILCVDAIPNGDGEFSVRVLHQPSLTCISGEPEEWESTWHPTPEAAVRAAIHRCEGHPLMTASALKEN